MNVKIYYEGPSLAIAREKDHDLNKSANYWWEQSQLNKAVLVQKQIGLNEFGHMLYSYRAYSH